MLDKTLNNPKSLKSDVIVVFFKSTEEVETGNLTMLLPRQTTMRMWRKTSRGAALLLLSRLSSCFSSTAAISLTPVQETSLLVAYWRHLEPQSENGLIQDVPAGHLVQNLLSDTRIQEFRNSPICSCGQEILAVRTRCIDDWLLDKRQPNPRQLVNLGAGMCARYHRLEGLANYYNRMWEVDSDLELLNIKKSVLDQAVPTSPSSLDLKYLEGDLASNSFSTSLREALLATSFETKQPTDWIVEGVLEYIDPNQHKSILDFTRSLSAPGSRMALQVLEEPLRDYFLNELGAEALPWQKLPPLEDFVDSAKQSGWKVERCIRPSDWTKLYNRELLNAPGFNMVFLNRN